MSRDKRNTFVSLIVIAAIVVGIWVLLTTGVLAFLLDPDVNGEDAGLSYSSVE